MEKKILIAGFGGQGVVLAGNILAYAALHEDKNILGMVSYGAEVRGGASSSSVIISDEEIDSPIIDKADILVIMSQESYDKFKGKVVKGGSMIVNTSEVNIAENHSDVKVVEIDATNIAKEMGNIRVANMVMLGALLTCLPIVKLESLSKAMEKPFSGKKKDLLYINESALKKGMEMAKCS